MINLICLLTYFKKKWYIWGEGRGVWPEEIENHFVKNTVGKIIWAHSSTISSYAGYAIFGNVHPIQSEEEEFHKYLYLALHSMFCNVKKKRFPETITGNNLTIFCQLVSVAIKGVVFI